MKLYALADLHLRYEVTRKALRDLRPHPYDWLIVAGDVGETEEHLRFALGVLSDRFARLLWVPGNHDLWSVPTKPGELRGQAKYERLVEAIDEGSDRTGISAEEMSKLKFAADVTSTSYDSLVRGITLFQAAAGNMLVDEELFAKGIPHRESLKRDHGPAQAHAVIGGKMK